jgi:AP endonuclease 2
VLESGVKLTLREALHMDKSQRQPPRIAAKFWDEFSGKQTLLSTFFGKRGNSQPMSVISSRPLTEDPSLDTLPPSSSPTPSESLQKSAMDEPPPADATSSQEAISQTNLHPSKVEKRKLTAEASTALSKPKKQKAGQTKLSSFFSKPSSSKVPSPPDMTPTPNDSQLESDYQFALQLSSSQDALISESLPVSTPSQTGDKDKGKAAWSQLLAPIQPPMCRVHNEPAKELTVNKPGPNKGKNFFICSR